MKTMKTLLNLFSVFCFFCCLGKPHFVNKGMFNIEEKINSTPYFQLYRDTTISWIKGSPPADAPKCGFENEKCIVEETPKLCKYNRPFTAASQKISQSVSQSVSQEQA